MDVLPFLVQKLRQNKQRLIREIPTNSPGQDYSVISRKGPVTNVKNFRGPITPINSCKCNMSWIFLTKKHHARI